jgi:hypothetical protein
VLPRSLLEKGSGLLDTGLSIRLGQTRASSPLLVGHSLLCPKFTTTSFPAFPDRQAYVPSSRSWISHYVTLNFSCVLRNAFPCAFQSFLNLNLQRSFPSCLSGIGVMEKGGRPADSEHVSSMECLKYTLPPPPPPPLDLSLAR